MIINQTKNAPQMTTQPKSTVHRRKDQVLCAHELSNCAFWMFACNRIHVRMHQNTDCRISGKSVQFMLCIQDYKHICKKT